MTDDEKIRLAVAEGCAPQTDGDKKIRLAAGRDAEEEMPLAKALTVSMGRLAATLATLSRPLRLPARSPKLQATQLARSAHSAFGKPGAIAPPAPAPPAAPAELPAPHVDPGQPLAYWDFRDRIAGAIRAKKVHPTAAGLVDHAAIAFGMNKAIAAEWTERFLHHLRSARHRIGAGARR